MPSNSLQPGPHDPYNVSSVKLAEATRVCVSKRVYPPSHALCTRLYLIVKHVLQIRLILPGLSAPDKEETCIPNRAGGLKLPGIIAGASPDTVAEACLTSKPACINLQLISLHAFIGLVQMRRQLPRKRPARSC